VAPLHLLRLAAVFDVTVDWFFDETVPLPVPSPLVDHAQPPGAGEVRRFLAAFGRLADGRVRTEIADLMKALGRTRLPEGRRRLTSDGS
jgi:hypothetical protein